MAGSRSSPLNRVMGAIVPRAVDAIDPDELIERLDLNAILARIDLQVLLDRLDIDAVLANVDIDALIARIDVDAVVARVDIDQIVGRVDIDRIINEVDIDAVVARVDIDRLMQRVDVDALVARIDVDQVVGQVDIAALVARAGIDQIVADATSGMATRALDLARRQVLGVDIAVLGLVDRVVRPRAEPPDPIGRVWSAGPVSRVLGFVVDSAAVSALFGLGVSLGGFLVELFTSATLDEAEGPGLAWLGAYALWWFSYLWLAVAGTGRTIGKGLVGLRVVALDGSPLRPGAAAKRAITFPFSFILGLGFLPAVFGASRRALHDYAAGSREIVDWGQREVVPPSRFRGR